MKALQGFIDEIENSRLRQKGETKHQGEIFKKARAKNFDPKAMRIVLQRRAMGENKADAQDQLIHSYELALGGKKQAADVLAAGGTIREAAEAGGISTGAAGNLAKVVQKSSFVDTPHDPDTGECLSGRDAGGVPSGRADGSDEHSTKSVLSQTALGDGLAPSCWPTAKLLSEAGAVVESTESRSPEGATSDSVASDQGAEPVVPTGNEGRAGERDPREQNAVLAEQDDLAIPTFLRRERVSA
ncbi:MAG: DUF2312 domain-containing protein [Hyphomonadaceae bacterium]|nr:DUF2312 domain-containing protein [Hyphomonadaceae bacterium]